MVAQPGEGWRSERGIEMSTRGFIARQTGAPTREWTCRKCRHVYRRAVRVALYTADLSGENREPCPACGEQRALNASPVQGGGFEGRYHHWDSYPEGLGATLFHLAQPGGPFAGDLPRMLKVLLDDHPAGWSTINGKDFGLEPGYEGSQRESARPECYCHGGRAEAEHTVCEVNAAGCGCEYGYVFTEAGHMLVLSSYSAGGGKMVGMFGMGDAKATWRLMADVDLHGPEPVWARLGVAA